jgi:hypothetical protein
MKLAEGRQEGGRRQKTGGEAQEGYSINAIHHAWLFVRFNNSPIGPAVCHGMRWCVAFFESNHENLRNLFTACSSSFCPGRHLFSKPSPITGLV